MTANARNADPLDSAMRNARTVVLAVFNRFGDGVISGVVCEEFAKKWSFSGCRFLVVTSPQLYPYLKAICPSAEVMALNRKNPLHWGKLLIKRLFEYRGFDVGLNPYSHGKESRRIARMGRWHKIYANLENGFLVNYYERVRRYLALAPRGEFVSASRLPEAVGKILVCPESSEARRSLTEHQFQSIIGQLRSRWPQATLTTAMGPKFPARYAAPGVTSILLDKSQTSSIRFLEAIRNADLVVSVDSGPLHIASALGTPVVALFSSAHPATVINGGADAYPLRAASLGGVYCEVLDCKYPVCMNCLTLETPWVRGEAADQRSISREQCPFDAA